MNTTPVSPKVLAGGIAGVLAAALLGLVQQLAGSQDFLSALPAWLQPLVPGLAATLVYAITAYLKRDPFRDLGHQTAAVQAAVPTGEAEDGFGPLADDDDHPGDDQPVAP